VNRLTEYFFQAPTGVFSQAEVAAALKASPFSRHALVKRALAKGEILGIRRGLYCLAPRYRKNPINVYAVAQRVYGPSYVSMESALSHHGWIPETVYACTCASFGSARKFDTPLGTFIYRRVPQRVFHAGVERCVDASGNVFLMAAPAKALADYVYVHRPAWRGMDEAAESLRIEPEDWTNVPRPEVESLLDNYANRRVRCVLESWMGVLTS
jgi:predicted transcriptional regulator of viral defense system